MVTVTRSARSGAMVLMENLQAAEITADCVLISGFYGGIVLNCCARRKRKDSKVQHYELSSENGISITGHSAREMP